MMSKPSVSTSSRQGIEQQPEQPSPEVRLLQVEAGLLVADKPSGLLCQPGLGPALADSLLTRVRREWPTAQLVHRLDRDTSGLLLLALDADLHRALSRVFAERRIVKTYQANVAGIPDQKEGSITLSIAKRSHRPPLYGPDETGKPCHTDWRLLEAFGDWSRLELRPHSGRSHQLRVHLAAIGHPILGDPLYGDPGTLSVERLCLHASDLAFLHPCSGRPFAFHSPCPF
jgi:tRNA pseudouridine32 synthase/23S rRNA pseudouridine746 synthase